MKLNLSLLLLSTIARTILASPARQDCGQTKTFTASNDCGISYGGTWIACASGMRAMPTFTMPPCPHTSTSPTKKGRGHRHHSVTTSAPPLPLRLHENRLADDNSTATAATTDCSREMVCIDGLASCGGEGTRFGGCYDMCTPSHSPTAPVCTITLSEALPVLSTGAPKPAPQRELLDECVDKPFLCAPTGW